MNKISKIPTPQELEERYGSIFDAMIEGVQIIDNEHRYLYINKAAEKQNKYLKKDLIGYTQTEKYPGMEKTEVYKQIHKCITKKIPATIENEFTFPDGSTGWYEVHSEPLPYGALILSLDITERMSLIETAKKESIEKALATERAETAEKLNKIVIDRELTMIKLKEKVAELEEKVRILEKMSS